MLDVGGPIQRVGSSRGSGLPKKRPNPSIRLALLQPLYPNALHLGIRAGTDSRSGTDHCALLRLED